LNISLREVTPADEPFLFEVYASTRLEELAGLDWDDNQKQAFIKMQFLARERTYPRVDNRIVILDDCEIGRILVDRNEHEILLVDIALLTEYRNSGIGSRLINDLLKEASESGKSVRLHVLQVSPAARLYERLGFQRSGGDAVYVEMMWTPPIPRSESL
jgi:ribosomal protein S18 acetylase RimI-like enzyme